ncbi:MAG: filamentous hemagglutinin N-terminal domain-containing protein, partial [Azoarcus sp.]|nr:filamentous hemagglutinin N-terminal domain-containing protein [Azoarcus sp.]
MNKTLYRVIFNKNRGQMMVVSELEKSEGKSAGEARCVTTPPPFWTGLRVLSFSVMLSLGSALIVPSAAFAQGIHADPNAPANQQPTVTQTSNGIPQVNITTPSAKGVSMNQYNQFDVAERGAILNNASRDAQTQLAGWVQANPNLSGGEARIIVNQVNSSDPSQLRGYIEVAGRRAEVIIANPSGILVNGAGFINASHVTLTTGQPLLAEGELKAYQVRNGTIVIEGKGLDTTDADYTRILAKAAEINAGIWAKDLKIVAGSNNIDAQGTVTPITDETQQKPQVSIDTSELGGMYAGKITLVSTDKGVGVNNAGQIGAFVGEVSITADGRLSNSGNISANTNVHADTNGGIANSGTIYAKGNTRLGTRGNVGNTGTIAAQGNTSIVGSSVTSDANSVIAAGVLGNGTLGGSGDVQVSATGLLTALGQNLAGGILSLTGASVNVSGSRTTANNLSINADNVDASRATLVSDGELQLTAQTARFDHGQTAANRLRINVGTLYNRNGLLLQTGTGMGIVRVTTRLDNTGGTLSSDGSMDITAGELINLGGTLSAGKALHIQSSDTLDNARGTFSAYDNLTMQTDRLTNDAGTLQAGGILTLTSANLTGSGKIISLGDMNLSFTGDFTHTGEMLANGNVTLQTASLLTNKGELTAGGRLAVSAEHLDNTVEGRISAFITDITVADTLTNRGLIDGAFTRINADTINNLGTGRIYGDYLALRADTLNNDAENGTAATIAARTRLDIGAQTLTNRDRALIFSAGDMSIGGALDANYRATGSAGTVNNNSGWIDVLGNLLLLTNQLNNTNEHF